jgi:hypothetical protein
LHAKTIIPLLEKTFRSILNTNHEIKGTLITSNSNKEGIKTLSVLGGFGKSRRKRFWVKQVSMLEFLE